MRHCCKVFAVVLASLTVAGAAQAQTMLRYKFKEGEKLEYVIDQDQKSTMSIGGMDIEMKTSMIMDMTLQTIKVDDKGNGEFKFTVSRVRMVVEGGPIGKVEADSNDKDEPDDQIGKMFHQIVKNMGGMEMTFTADPSGEAKDTKITEGTVKKLKGIPGLDKLGGDMLSPDNFKSMAEGIIVPLPKETAEKGTSWTQKLNQKMPFGKVTGENKYTYEGEIEKNGKKFEKISVKPVTKIEPDGKGPIKISVKDSKGKGYLLFDNKIGRVAESSSESTMQMEMEILGMSIDQNITQNTTMRLRGPGKKTSDKEK